MDVGLHQHEFKDQQKENASNAHYYLVLVWYIIMDLYGKIMVFYEKLH